MTYRVTSPDPDTDRDPHMRELVEIKLAVGAVECHAGFIEFNNETSITTQVADTLRAIADEMENPEPVL